MSINTGIEWTDSTWNPIRGCSRVSEGCRHCYAEAVAARFSGEGQPYYGLARRRSTGEPVWTGVARVIDEHMLDPLRWQRPRRVFVNSMSDLFHETLSTTEMVRVFAVMMLAGAYGRGHVFQLLTKRPGRMRDLLTTHGIREVIANQAFIIGREMGNWRVADALRAFSAWPLPNVWLGVSVEHQAAADERIPLLLQTPAAIRFLSCEPLLAAIDLKPFLWRAMDLSEIPGSALNDGCTEGETPRKGLHWVIVGGESGNGARPCAVEWMSAIVDNCRSAGCAVFVKQLGAVPMMREDAWRARETQWMLKATNRARVPEGYVPLRVTKKGGDFDEIPERLRFREFPSEART